jgi:hypothetical protein
LTLRRIIDREVETIKAPLIAAAHRLDHETADEREVVW